MITMDKAFNELNRWNLEKRGGESVDKPTTFILRGAYQRDNPMSSYLCVVMDGGQDYNIMRAVNSHRHRCTEFVLWAYDKDAKCVERQHAVSVGDGRGTSHQGKNNSEDEKNKGGDKGSGRGLVVDINSTSLNPSFQSEPSYLVTPANPVSAIHVVVGFSLRSYEVRNGTRDQEMYNLVLDNWIRMVKYSKNIGIDGGHGTPNISQFKVQLMVCLDVQGDAKRVQEAAEAQGFSVNNGDILILDEEVKMKHESYIFGFQRAQSERVLRNSDSSGFPYIVITSFCEKHPVYRSQPTYRGIFAAAEALGYYTTGMKNHNCEKNSETDDSEFYILYANSDIIVDPQGLFSTLLSVTREKSVFYSSSSSDRKNEQKKHNGDSNSNSEHRRQRIFISGRRSNCELDQIKLFNNSTGSLNFRQLEKRCHLFRDDAQDYFLVSNRLLIWSPDASYSVGGSSSDKSHCQKDNDATFYGKMVESYLPRAVIQHYTPIVSDSVAAEEYWAQ